MSSNSEINASFDHILGLTQECGQVIKSALNLSKNVTTKANAQDFVTEYDKKIETMLVNGILSRFPHHRVLSEEAMYGKQMPELTNDPTWIIDPIDGTTNFMKGLRLNCISIALAVDKQLVAAICFNPCMNELYTAKKGQGTCLNGVPVKTTNVQSLKESLVSFSLFGRPLNKTRILGLSSEYMRGTIGFRVFGSIAVALSFVAGGVLDAYHIEGAAPWDCAAGILLIEEAGGSVKSINGGEYDIMKPDIIAACSEAVVNDILKIIQKYN